MTDEIDNYKTPDIINNNNNNNNNTNKPISATFGSRYRDPRTVHYVDDKTAYIEFKSFYTRYSWSDELKCYQMIDPDGGPFISIGLSLYDLDTRLPKKKISRILKVAANYSEDINDILLDEEADDETDGHTKDSMQRYKLELE